jgi:hypothetical protein
MSGEIEKRPESDRRVARTPAASAQRRGPRRPATVTMQARVDAAFAAELIQTDGPALGLSGPSELVREGLVMLHRYAQEMIMAKAYDEYYGGQPAPVSGPTAALWTE